jgi:hypothetical protein
MRPAVGALDLSVLLAALQGDRPQSLAFGRLCHTCCGDRREQRRRNPALIGLSSQDVSRKRESPCKTPAEALDTCVPHAIRQPLAVADQPADSASGPMRPEVEHAQVAQLVEQRIENPRVGGSNPPLGTTPFKNLACNPPRGMWRHAACERLAPRRFATPRAGPKFNSSGVRRASLSNPKGPRRSLRLRSSAEARRRLWTCLRCRPGDGAARRGSGFVVSQLSASTEARPFGPRPLGNVAG